MKSLRNGKSTLKPEVVNVSEHGFWLFWKGREYFMPFAKFPWFKDTTISQISDVEILHGEHLYWPELDVDLTFNIIRHPEKYKLISN
jgi:hypothetical protein